MSDKNRYDIYPSDQLVKAIDNWRGQQINVPTRAEAARRLLEMALIAEGVVTSTKPAKM